MDDFDASVLTENNQYKALSLYFKEKKTIIEDVKDLNQYTRLTQSTNMDLDYIKKMMHNSWNTEILIKENLKRFSNDLNVPLHWVLPQTYYSVYLNLCAMYSVLPNQKYLGQNSHHSKIIKIFSQLIEQNYFPSKLSFYADGIRKSILLGNIDKPEITEFNVCKKYQDSDIDAIKKQICCLLTATRGLEIESKKWNAIKEENSIRRKNNSEISKIKGKNARDRTNKEKLFIQKNKRKKDLKILLRPLEETISSNIKKTTILNYLYRKRIKSNYDAIDNYLHEDIDAKVIIHSCILMLELINSISEIYLYKLIGKENFISLLNNNFSSIRGRLNQFLDLNP